MLLKPVAERAAASSLGAKMEATAVSVPMGARGKGKGMRMTMATASTMSARIHRKGFRIPSKKHPGKALPGKLHSISRIGPGKIPPGKRIPQRPHPASCDNSNDSGFGFDQHVELQQNAPQHVIRTAPLVRSMPSFGNNDRDDIAQSSDTTPTPNCSPHGAQVKPKRRKIESVVSIDNDDACSQDAFVKKLASAAATPATVAPSHAPKYMNTATRTTVRPGLKRQPVQPPNSVVTSNNGRVQLEIVSQPEQQHRARYQTEGSRGAVKDRSGNGFPIVRLSGYNKSAILQVFIGTDIGRVAPHMFYQACKVAGKNSTQCSEKKVDGTMIIEIEFKPETDMTITCDCVGILKERNVDVEHRFPDHLAQKNKKKSTRCRMVFRTQLTHDDGSVETVQICSNPIICTQPPGVPEICKKSLNSCPVEGGLELFIIGKNFLKDTCVVFKEYIDSPQSSNDLVEMTSLWEQTVLPDKEYLQQTHLVCIVPPYIRQNLHKPITIELFIMSSGKKSESHSFVYTPTGSHTVLSAATTLSTLPGTIIGQDAQYLDSNGQSHVCSPTAAHSPVAAQLWGSPTGLEPKHELDTGMMPPPATNIPIGMRRPSASSSLLTEQIAQLTCLKTEIIDENSSHSMPDAMQTDSLDQFPVAANGAVMSLESAMEYERIRKQNLDLTMSLMTEANSISNFAAPHQAHMGVDMTMSAAAGQSGPETAVEKFFSSISELKAPQIDASATNALYGQAHPQSAVAMFPPIEQALSNILSSANNSPVPMDQILSLSQQHSPSNSSTSSVTSSPNSANFDSPIPHDIILNSNSAATIGTANMMLTPNPAVPSPAEIATDIILNAAVSPTLLCPGQAAEVVMATTILNEMASSMPSQVAQDALLYPPTGATVVTEATAASTAVSNMMIKAAEDFMTNQEKNATTINALMSQCPMPTQAEVSQILNSQVTTTAATCQSQAQLMPSHQSAQNVLVDMLMTHGANVPSPHIRMGVTSISTPESLLQTGLAGPVLAEPQNVGQSVPQVQTAQPAAATIPQELTIMSDQDLISYINPSAFDQV